MDTIPDDSRSEDVSALGVAKGLEEANIFHDRDTGLSTGHCYAEKPPVPNAEWVDDTCEDQLVGGMCIAQCVDGYEMSDGSDDTFVCLKDQQFVPQTKFECEQKTDAKWHVFGLSLDKVNFKSFHFKDVAGWDLQTQLVFGGAFLVVFLCSLCACYKCCKRAWCCRSQFRGCKRSSQANEPIVSWDEVYDLYPEMWAPPLQKFP